MLQDLASNRVVVIAAAVVLVLSLVFLSWKMIGGRRVLATPPEGPAVVNPQEEYSIPRGAAAGQGYGPGGGAGGQGGQPSPY
jgi:hypothetical protein